MSEQQAKRVAEAIELMIRNYFKTACVPNRDAVHINGNDRRVDYARDQLLAALRGITG